MAEHASDRVRADGRTRTLVPEAIPLSILMLALLWLRTMYLFHHVADSDESQHLHVIWGWTRGLVQYRDLFDNHAPLFHLMLAPAFDLLGERPDIVLLARVLMLPLTALSLWATYRLGSVLWSRRVGAWAAVLSALVPTWLLTTTEFRADALWTAAWLCALVVLLGGTLTPRRAFAGGILLGAAFATSLKSILLLAALAMAALAILAVAPRSRIRWARNGAHTLASLLAGFALLPCLLLFAFWRMGALSALVYCTAGHNVLAGLGSWRAASVRWLLLPAACGALLPAAHLLLRRPAGPVAHRRVLLMLTTGFVLALLEGYWPIITREDHMPWIPMLVVCGVAAAEWAWRRGALGSMRRASRLGLTTTLMCVAAVEIVSVLRTEAAWRDDSVPETRLLSDVLRMTQPGEPILDLKGETVFRPRPYYFVLEGITKARIARGLIPDRIASSVERTRTHFAVLDSPDLPSAARRFLDDHFVPAGGLRVLGADLGPRPGAARRERAFDVSYPERFAIVVDGAPGRGRLDGSPYRRPALLEAGAHYYRPASGERHPVVVWAGALGRAALMSSLPGGEAVPNP